MNVLTIDHISKHYGSLRALDDLSLDIRKGDIHGILGPNGSGKTTTLGIVLGIIKSTSGTYSWFGGMSPQKARRRVGALLETPNFYPYLNADDNLAIIRHIKQSSETNFDHILELVQLKDRRKSKFNTYSLGMKQRLAIAAALVGDPEVLILDEPTNGLDPEGIADVRNTIRAIGESGKTIVMASHILAEVEKVCTHVSILKQGKILAEGPVGAILSDEICIEVAAKDMGNLGNALSQIEGVIRIDQKDGLFEIMVAHSIDPADLNHRLVTMGIYVTHLAIKRSRLEDEFLEVIK
ncbi:MAG: ATP-binding cassette domain-containing protein [Saprospiraceae bacterium]|nr:ATP-binding cassette domain-containing protein [Saprospiraceae bacterium]